MQKYMEAPVALDHSAGSTDVTPPTVTRRAPWPGDAPRSVPYAPPPTTVLEPEVVDPKPSEQLAQFSGPRPLNGLRVRGAALAPLFVSTGAFVAWLILMVTVVAENGTASQIIGITILPLVAHVVSLYLTARGGVSSEAIGT